MRIVFDSWRRGVVVHSIISILIPSRLKIPLISRSISPIRNPIVPSSVIILVRCLAHRITLDERVVEILVIPVHRSLERSLVRSFEVVRRTLIIEFIVGVARGIRFIGRVGLASDRVVEIRSPSLIRCPRLASRESGFRGSGHASIPARCIRREAVHAADRGGLRSNQVKIEICPDGEGILAFAGGCWSRERWAPSASNASLVRIGIGE